MKKFTKICLIICGIFLVLGIVFCIIGVVCGFNTQQFKQLVHEGAWSVDEVKNLDIDFNFGTLIIQPSESDSIEVSTEYRSNWKKYVRTIQWKMDGDTLELKDSLDKKIFQLFSYSSDDAA